MVEKWERVKVEGGIKILTGGELNEKNRRWKKEVIELIMKLRNEGRREGKQRREKKRKKIWMKSDNDEELERE